MDIWGSSQNWTIFRGNFYAFLGYFLRSRYRMVDIFFGCYNFKCFGVLEISNLSAMGHHD